MFGNSGHFSGADQGTCKLTPLGNAGRNGYSVGDTSVAGQDTRLNILLQDHSENQIRFISPDL